MQYNRVEICGVNTSKLKVLKEAEKTELLKKVYPDVALTTDIIVGFPQETDEEFEKTYQFLKDIAFYKMHIFKYSQRKGTKAAIMRWTSRWKSKRRKK